ncbi:MAG: 3-keto-5-aminohexanoate cleavage protein [Oscillochloris sp.]|nr:3-keto-5-aminohexanoate cleavage protein [Oscillochloris sp.]
MEWSDKKIVITCALTGGIHGKEANANLPEQPDEIVAQGIAAWRAGAAILHVHARNSDGSNTMDREIYQELHERLCAETDAIIQLTTGGSPRLPVNERLNTVLLNPEMCSLNMGLMNFFIRGEQVFFSNHRSDILRFAQEMKRRGVVPELEVYNMAMIEEAEWLLSQGILEPPFVINYVLQTPTQGGLRGTPINLVEMTRRLPANCILNISSMGRTQLPITTMAACMGLNIRVGMEDNVYYRKGELVQENAQLVDRAVRICRDLQREPASPDEARRMLNLRGRERGQLPPLLVDDPLPLAV